MKNAFSKQCPVQRDKSAADVGLRKTIEADILFSQRWVKRRRKPLIIVPANLRRQWSQELSDKFFLPSAILQRGLSRRSSRSEI